MLRAVKPNRQARTPCAAKRFPRNGFARMAKKRTPKMKTAV
jgi:hypothetical protein